MKKELTTPKDIWLFLRYFKKLFRDALYPSLLIYFFISFEKYITFVNYTNLSDRVIFF
jgi:hypothetical protein